MNVSLTPELERMIHEKVQSGLYNSASEVIREALRLQSEYDHARHVQVARLHEGLEQAREQIAAGRGLDTHTARDQTRAIMQERSRG